MEYRPATITDVPALARMNQQLIEDEGHRNRMPLGQLEQRMSGWLTSGEYAAVMFVEGGQDVGYALYRFEAESVYLRQFFVGREYRRAGVGRAAIIWLKANTWADASIARIDVLVGNATGQAFWRAVGFTDYCITMELPIQ